MRSNTRQRPVPVWRGWLLAIVLLSCYINAVSAQTPDPWNTPVEVDITGFPGGMTQLVGTLTMPASREFLWDVLTDYDHLADFIESLVEARMLTDSGRVRYIYQKGRQRILFFHKTVELTLRVEEFYPDSITYRLVDGPFHHYSGSWRLTARQNGGAVLRSQTVSRPAFFAPQFLYRSFSGGPYRQMLREIRQEVRRRLDAARVSPNPE